MSQTTTPSASALLAAAALACSTAAAAAPNRIGLRPVQIRLSRSGGNIAPVYAMGDGAERLFTIICLVDDGSTYPDGSTDWKTLWKVACAPSLHVPSHQPPPMNNLTTQNGCWVALPPNVQQVLQSFNDAFRGQEMTLEAGIARAQQVLTTFLSKNEVGKAAFPQISLPDTFRVSFGKSADTRDAYTRASARSNRAQAVSVPSAPVTPADLSEF